MPLKVELKPGERFILGESVITNGDHRATFIVEGDAPILREKDILRTEDADSPCKLIYLSIQLTYLSGDPERHQNNYLKLVGDVMKAAPSLLPQIEKINNLMLTGSYYKALREAKTLIGQEKDLIAHAKRC